MIEGKRVKLRAIELGDAETYHAWINDAETNQWRGLYHPTSKAGADTWIQEQSMPSPDRLSLSIEASTESASVTHVGLIGIRGICSRSRRAELWIYIGDKTLWGSGYGVESVEALCRYAFEEMNLYRIWMECDPEFKAAVKCYETAGFVKEGVLRKAYYRRGEYRDTCIMGLLRPDFERKSKK